MQLTILLPSFSDTERKGLFHSQIREEQIGKGEGGMGQLEILSNSVFPSLLFFWPFSF